MAPSTTPPATMLSKKFLRDGETPGPAASATSGITMEAVRAAAVNPVANFSLKDPALICSRALGLWATTAFDGLTGNGLKKASELGNRFWIVRVEGMAIETAEVEAIFVLSSLCFSE